MPDGQTRELHDPLLFIPIPQGNRDLLKNSRANFSLAFPRLMQWKEKEAEEGLDKPLEAIETLCKIAQKSMHPLKGELDKIHRRQERILKHMEQSGLPTLTVYAELSSPFISGLGSGHPNETGMILDRNTGCPFLPASSIKGVLRMACALNLAEAEPDKIKDGNLPDELLRKYFGDVDGEALKIKYLIPRDERTRGQLVFLDSYPVSPPLLKMDIMNPHYVKYYDQKEAPYHGPAETESPRPIKFIALEQGNRFAFRCFFLPLASDKKNDNQFFEKEKDTLRAMFQTAFSRLGFGGKTAVGYGRFREITETEARSPVRASPPSAASNLIQIKTGEKYAAILLDVKTKKGKWRARLRDYPDKTGFITNSIPEDKKEGGEIQVLVKSVPVDNNDCSFEFIIS
ncbi:MAG: type III-B CRISPR module RAMP protein Cmr6 [Treponema sp.]|jgi:CRISPR-associated protein Cmr6|nr:type III-B CRISPR module RAMP protein Cmr6 [Treponema sp.]